MDPKLAACLKEFARSREPVAVMTGAGISAESSIPTFRGPEGYWTVGAKEYQPQEMATFAMFSQEPLAVWQWYLYRLAVCRKARPNAGHTALVEMEALFGDRFTLITQNVDGLHLRAGNTPARTYQIHGNVSFMRCSRECTDTLYPVPQHLEDRDKTKALTEKEVKQLICPACGGMTRPHVLWFDETYNEKYFRFHSAIDTARRTGLLLIVGTSGATNLPNQVAMIVRETGGILIDVNIEANPFTRMALSGAQGFFIQEKSGKALPEILAVFREALKDGG